MLGGEDVVEERPLVEIGVARLRLQAVQVLRELEHIVRIAGLRAVDVADEVNAGVHAREVLPAAVAAEREAAPAGHVLPEPASRLEVALVAGELRDARKAHSLGNLRIGVHVIEDVLVIAHGVQQQLVREAAGAVEIRLVAADRVRVGQHLVHAAVLVAEHPLHLFVVQPGGDPHRPVAEAQEQVARLLVAAVHPRVAQAGEHLVQVVERRPGGEIAPELPVPEIGPEGRAAREAAHVVEPPFGVLLRVRVGHELQLGEHVLHPAAALFVARGGVDGHRRQVVARHMAVQAVPVGIGRRLGLQARLLAVRGQQAVAVVLEQGVDIEVAGVLERTVQQDHVPEGEFIRVQFVLRRQGGAAAQQGQQGDQDLLHHRLILRAEPS